jgi:hypothetical protein
MQEPFAPGTGRETGRAEIPRSPRRKTVFGGMLETVGGRAKVAVRNVSCTGAMVEGEQTLPPGRDLILDAAGLELFCSVVWSDDGRCGLRFDEPLSPGQVLALHRITPEEVRRAEQKAEAESYIVQGWYVTN